MVHVLISYRNILLPKQLSQLVPTVKSLVKALGLYHFMRGFRRVYKWGRAEGWAYIGGRGACIKQNEINVSERHDKKYLIIHVTI